MNKWIWMVFFLIAAFWGRMVWNLAAKIRIEQPVFHEVSLGKEDMVRLLQGQERPDTALPDPFQIRNPATVHTVAKPAITPSEAMPAILVDAILWGPTPVAILKWQGSTQVVQKGQKAFGCTIKDILQNQVVVLWSGKSHVLKK